MNDAKTSERIRNDQPIMPGNRRSQPYRCAYEGSIVMTGQKACFGWSVTKIRMCPQQDSNLRTRLRRAVLYPLSYGGSADKE